MRPLRSNQRGRIRCPPAIDGGRPHGNETMRLLDMPDSHLVNGFLLPVAGFLR